MVITDLGEIGENAIVVFEEAVGVGAEEIVCGQVLSLECSVHPFFLVKFYHPLNLMFSRIKNLSPSQTRRMKSSWKIKQ